MNSRLLFLQTLMPVVELMTRSRDPKLAAEAAEEHASLSKEVAKLRRAEASKVEGAQGNLALKA